MKLLKRPVINKLELNQKQKQKVKQKRKQEEREQHCVPPGMMDHAASSKIRKTLSCKIYIYTLYIPLSQKKKRYIFWSITCKTKPIMN